ncbi:MAG: ribosome recycling factor [Thermoleophilia bacterium]|nr:ribosome recycling factor [Thermoleophilia bacterium]
MATHGMGATRRRMEGALEDARVRMAGLRAGRATVELVAGVRVQAWGSELPLAQVAQVSAQPPRALVITAHDPSLVPAIERALGDSDLGARPRVDGVRVRLELPAPTAERRDVLAKQARELAEDAKVAVRLARRDAINELRRSRAADEISEGKLNGRSKDLQVMTDEHVARADELLATTLRAIAE